MDVHLPRRTRLRVPSDDVRNDNVPREDLCGLVNFVEHVQHRLAAQGTGHVLQVRLDHTPNGRSVEPGEHRIGH